MNAKAQSDIRRKLKVLNYPFSAQVLVRPGGPLLAQVLVPGSVKVPDLCFESVLIQNRFLFSASQACPALQLK